MVQQRFIDVGFRRKVTPFGVLAVVAFLIAILITIQGPWVADFWLHAATIDRLRADLANPGNPAVAVDTGSPYYTPYTLVLAVLGRLSGLSGIEVLTLWGPVNVALLLWGVRSFARRFGESPWHAVALFATMLLIWGSLPLGWSGFISLFGIPLVMGYPSTFAFALTLLLWSMLFHLADSPGMSRRSLSTRILALSALGATIALSHQFTAVVAALGGLAIVLSRWRKLSWKLVLGIVGAGALALALCLVWPYYRLGDLVTSVAILDGLHVMLYKSWWPLFGHVAVTLPFLALRFARDRSDPLVIMFLVGAAVVAYGGWSGQWSWARVIPLMVFAGQAAAAFQITDWLTRFRRSDALPVTTLGRGALVLLTLSACAVGLRVQGGNLLHVAPLSAWPPRLVSIAKPALPGTDYSWLTAHARRGDVIATIDREALRTIPAYGFNIVAPTWPDPLLPDDRQRRIDQELMIDPNTDPMQRRLLLRKYQVQWILIKSADEPMPDDLLAFKVTRGPHGQMLFLVGTQSA